MQNSYAAHMDKLVAEAPNQIPQERITELLEFGSVRLSMDGNAGCALLGPDLQEGEAEFETINLAEFDDGWDNASKRSIVRALNKLRARCGGQSLPYHYA